MADECRCVDDIYSWRDSMLSGKIQQFDKEYNKGTK